MNSASSKSERTRNFIIESTAEIFNKKGFAGTSLSDLTEATGLSKGSIYGNFENKEEVALAVFDYNLARLTQAISAEVQKTVTYYEKLMVYTRIYRNVSGNIDRIGGCPILNTAIEADDTHDLLKDKASKAVIQWKKNLVRIIEGGIEAGEFKPDVNINQTAVSIIALIEGGIMMSRVTGDPSQMSMVLKTVELMINQITR